MPLDRYMPTSQHLTTTEVAKMLGCDISTVNRKVRRGELRPHIKAPGLRGAHLFEREEIERYLDAQREDAAS